MCKYHNRIFVFTLIEILLFLSYVENRSLNKKKTFNLLGDFSDDYDMHFDQRQNGTENFRLNLDGFLIAIPSEALMEPENSSNKPPSYADELLSIFENLEKKASSGNSYEFDKKPLGDHSEISAIEETGEKDKGKVQSVKILNHEDKSIKTNDVLHISAAKEENARSAEVVVNNQKSSSPWGKLHNNDKKVKSKYRLLNLLKLFRRNIDEE